MRSKEIKEDSEDYSNNSREFNKIQSISENLRELKAFKISKEI